LGSRSLSASAARHCFAAFTIIELLAVVAIMAIIAAMVGPTLTGFRKGDVMLSATRQALDAVAYARQLAISEHTTVYMVFVPPGFWGPDANAYTAGLRPSERPLITNMLAKQYTGYAFVSLRSIGDQPGRYAPRYLSSWQKLPEGAFIPGWKFQYRALDSPPGSFIFRISNTNSGQRFDVDGFLTNTFPVPEDAFYNQAPYFNTNTTLPYVAFNYLGQLTSGDGQLLDRDEYIPLAHGSVVLAYDQNRTPVMDLSGTTNRESPAWNSTNSYNLIHIDRLTGRARLEHREAVL
jgi:type II secretory pathway pseudopilin PulG